MPITPVKASFAERAIDSFNRAASRIMDTKGATILMPENPTDIAKTLALISTTTKDIVNCYYYTTQSYHNERIPEDKRKFVAGIDLANGILNVITQLSLGLVVNKMSDKMYDKWFKGGLTATAENIKKYREAADKLLHGSQLTEHIKCSDASIKSAINKVNKVAKAGFGVIAVLVVTQIIAKRMIVPFLATPLAKKKKKYLDKQEAKKATGNDSNTEQNKTKPEIKEELPIPQAQEHKAFKGFEDFLSKAS